MIGLCTDSGSQLPPALVERYGVEVVPVTVCVDDHEYLEGVDLDPDSFYAVFRGDRTPVVGTALPSPGQFALAYERLAERGAREILSVHSSWAPTGALSAARLAARHSPVPVRLVDAGHSGPGLCCCVWAAADALAAGAALDRAVATVEMLAPRVGNVFLADARGLLGCAGADRAVPVLSVVGGAIEVVARTDDLANAVAAMAAYALGWRCGTATTLNVAIATADAVVSPVAGLVEAALRASGAVGEVVHCRVGPSAGAHTSPGAVGVAFFPT